MATGSIYLLLLLGVNLSSLLGKDYFVKKIYFTDFSDDYMPQVNMFGNFLWTAAIWSISTGLLTDCISSLMSNERPIMKSKVIVVCSIMIGRLISTFRVNLTFKVFLLT